MSIPLPDSVDVLISGGGPSGLFLALDLAQRGINAHIVEPRVELDWTRPRAKTTNARTMTHLRRLGLADALRKAAPLTVEYAQDVIFCTSLNGYELTRFRNAFQVHNDRYDAQPECGQQVAQPVVEQVLRDAVDRSELAQLHTGWSFDRSEDVPDGRVVHLRHSAGSTREIHARYLIGADGVSSAVRNSLGVRLEGSSAAKSNLGVVFRSNDLEAAVTLDPAVQYWVVGNTYAGMVGALDRNGLWWSIVQGYDPDAPKFRDVATAEVLRGLIGIDADIEVVAEDPWTARMLLSPIYRDGSVFLVGDAAHANPPWGGHGFNTCIGDAANLAWKLAAVLHGWAGPELLDTYGSERRPIARRTIDEAVANGTVLADDLLGSDLAVDSDVGIQARELAVSKLAVKESEFSSLGLVLGYHYGESDIVVPAGTSPPAVHPIRYDASAAPGCLLPHAWLSDGTSLYDILGVDYTVLVAPGVSRDELDAVADVLEAVPMPSIVRQLEVRDVHATLTWDATILLVRPDQHVGWRGTTAADLLGVLRVRFAELA
ncbi:MAG: FAD-dependent monooxygenase [Rhodococcus sp. (in: high G+C Gram-positive bacteria)]